MEQMKVSVQRRLVSGKEIAKKLRKEGKIPAVVYDNASNIMLTIPLETMKKLRAIRFSESTVIDMEVLDGATQTALPVLIKQVQFDPVTERVVHIDFLKVSLEEKIRVRVPVVLKGEPKTVKEGEGVLEQILRELEIEGLPLNIPKKIEIDVSELVLGRSLHAADVKVSENLKIITHSDATIVTVVSKTEEVVEASAVEGVSPQEPEVIKEKKEMPEEGKQEKAEKPDKDKK